MRKVRVTSPVRSCDIDKFNHLNNARYPLYFELGRKALEKEYGVDVDVLLPQRLGLLVVRWEEMEFFTQVYAKELVEIRSQFEKPDGKAIIYIQHEMYREEELVAKARTKHYFYNFEEKRPIRPLKSFLEQFL